MTAAQALIESTLQGGIFPSLRQLELLRGARPVMLRDFEHEERRIITAGMILARLRTDDLTGAVELADAVVAAGSDVRDLDAAPTTFLALECALAETYLTAGTTVGLHRRIDRILSIIDEVADPRWWYRVLGIAATSRAFEGDIEAAEGYLDAAHAVAIEHDESRSQESVPATTARQPGLAISDEEADFMCVIANLVVGASSLDVERISGTVPLLHDLVVSDPRALLFAQLAESAVSLLTGDLSAALALAGRVTRVSDDRGKPGILHYAARCLEAEILIARGEPLHALKHISAIESPGSHVLCPGVVRASARLQLGDYRGVLVATTSCAKIRTKHSQWTLPGVLARRAIANMRLGHEATAMNDIEDTMQLLRPTGAAATFFLIPPNEMAALRDFVEVRNPVLGERLAAVQQLLDQELASQGPTVKLPRLSAREQVIAGLLRSPRSYPEIADAEHVALSTVKSQALAVFKKLNVNTREEAVLLLERAGFYET
ncbi:hypothetical protein JD292_09805 [Leucobacter sp. CSA2]|uniref:HTH luxR-type domain-containing protein n=1 Tax=Leucobacter edaphi TaxID=2796472 RepID=A0A934QF64_9MICO|nr:LuxR family transcriptional regulator [Leucobacter edaphi]MBK0422367.1 hypothetical protein [Leucobacter edaphi]